MLHIQNLHEGKALFQALGSEVRVQILELLLSEGEMNLSFLAARLHLTNGALTAHIKKLEAGSLIRLTAKSTGHGSEKIISLAQDKMLVELAEREPHPNVFSTSIPIGSYCECDVYPTCGLAAPDHLIGTVDDRRYFFHSDRSQAQILWFTRGYVEYVIPNFIPTSRRSMTSRSPWNWEAKPRGTMRTGPLTFTFCWMAYPSPCGLPRETTAPSVASLPRTGGMRTGTSMGCSRPCRSTTEGLLSMASANPM